MMKIKAAAGPVVVLGLAGWAIYTVSLQAERDRLVGEVESARQETQDAITTLARERAAWKVATLAITTAAQAQGVACRADMERCAQIDEIGRESVVIERPEGGIDEQTSQKVVNMFNNSLYAPLGGRVRTEAN